MPENPQDAEQIKILVILHYIAGGLSLAGLLFVVGHFLLMSSVFTMFGEMPQKVKAAPPLIEKEVKPDVPDPARLPSPPVEVVDGKLVNEFNSEAIKGMMGIADFFYFGFGIYFITKAILNFMSARYLGQRRKRTFSIVTAGLNCISFPLGTALGVFTIIVLSR
jgi:hypothetical protein